MKKLFSFIISIVIVSALPAQSVGIGTNTPNPSAQLEVNSTTKGFLPPRMTYTQRDAIQNPVAGMVIWCTNCAAPNDMGETGELQVFAGRWAAANGDYSGSGSLVKICNQVWMTKNLNVSKYKNGDPIPFVPNNAAWNALTTGAWCWYNNDSATYGVYGKLYNWYAVTDPRGLAPEGWHIPSDAEFTTLTDCLGGAGLVAGGKMKEAGTTHWVTPNTGATNSSGFTALPGGYRSVSGDGNFFYAFSQGSWWSTTEYSDPTFGMNLTLAYSFANAITLANGKADGLSVRCVRD